MCRAGGRRCPSDKAYSVERRSARNARRRARYAKVKAGVFTLETIHGPLEVNTSVVDSDSRFAYRNGQCFALALGLAERVEGSRVGIIVRDSEADWGLDYSNLDDAFLLRFDDGWFADAVHAVVVSPDGDEVLDVDGFRDIEGLREEVIDIHEGSLVIMDAADLRALLTRGHADPVQNFPAGERMAVTVMDVHMGDGTTSALEEYADPIAYEFLNSYGAKWGDLRTYSPEQFAGLCEAINGDFVHYLHDQDAEPLLVDYVALAGSDAPVGYAHTVSIVDGYVYDFTYRQVAPQAPIPLVVPVEQWESQWRRLQAHTPVDLGFDDVEFDVTENLSV